LFRRDRLASLAGIGFGLAIVALTIGNPPYAPLQALRIDGAISAEEFPAFSRHVSLLVGAAMLFVSCLALAERSDPKGPLHVFLRTRERAAVRVLLGVFLGLYVLLALRRHLNRDEYEHIHMAWEVGRGRVPYRDFFQNHNPLFWYALTPVLALAGHTADALLAVRCLMLGCALAILAVVHRIARLVTGSGETALVAALFLASMVVFAVNGLEARPDIPETLFGLLATLFVLRFLKRPRPYLLLLAGACAAVSFLFLQKCLALIGGLVVLLAWKQRPAEIARRIGWFALAALPPVLLLLWWLYQSGALGDYWLTTVLLNLHKRQAVPRWSAPLLFFVQNPAFILLTFWAAFSVLRDRTAAVGLRATAFLFVLTFALVLPVKNLWWQHFVLPAALACVPAAHVFCLACRRRGRAGAAKLSRLAALLVVPFVILASLLFFDNRLQLERIDYVVQHTRETDAVYHGVPYFNLFRPDLHYFWSSADQRSLLDSYNEISGGRYADFDACRLVREKKPAVVSNYDLDLDACGLRTLYQPTPFSGLYLRAGASSAF
jgi:hypothetical protein